MLANNRTDKLTGLLKYEIISIIVIRGRRIVGTPLGTNILKYLKPCLANPIIVTMKNGRKAVQGVAAEDPSSKVFRILSDKDVAEVEKQIS